MPSRQQPPFAYDFSPDHLLQAPATFAYPFQFRGLNTEDLGRTAPAGSAVSMSGVWIRTRGGIERALGSQSLGAVPWTNGSTATCEMLFMFRLDNGDGTTTRQLLAVVTPHGGGASGLYKYQGGSWSTIATGVFADSIKIGRDQYGNRVFMTDGSTLKVWDGTTLQNWYQAPPTAAPTHNAESTDASGELVAGAVYKIAFSLYSSTTLDETNISATLEITFTGSGGDNVELIDIPANTVQARFDKARIYRTAANEATLLYEQDVAYTGGALTAVMVGIVPDDELGPEIGAENYASPPDGRDLRVWDDHLWMTGLISAPKTARFCVAGSPMAWPNAQGLTVDRYDGYRLTTLRGDDVRAYLYAQNRAYVIGPAARITYEARPLRIAEGCVSPMGIAETPGGLFGTGRGVLWRAEQADYAEISGAWSTVAKALSDSVTPDQPTYLEFDFASDRRRIAVVTYDGVTAGLIGLAGDWMPGAITGEVAHVCDRDNGRAWVLTADRDGSNNLLIYEWYEDSNGDPIIPDTSGVAVYETAPVDVAPNVGEKFFEYAEILLAPPTTGTTPTGSLGVTFKYNDGRFSDAEYPVDLDQMVTDGFTEPQWVKVPCKITEPRETISIRFEWEATAEVILLQARIVWRPVDSVNTLPNEAPKV